MTPEQLLETDSITAELMADGWTEADLQAARFFMWNPELPFSSWSITVPPDKDLRDIGAIKAYLALRWLWIDDPPPSRNRDDAWAYVAAVKAAPLIDAGIDYIVGQRRRASRPRGRLQGEARTLGQLITDLATQPDHRDATPAELWPHLFAALYELSPVERPNSSDMAKAQIEYDGRSNAGTDADAPRKTISYGQFCKVVAKARQNGPL